MFNLFKKSYEIYTPVNGEVIQLDKVSDPVFSEKMMGEGFAVKPSDGNICSPIKGTVKAIFPSLHALTLESEDGLNVLLHIGLDTVELNGEGFSTGIQVGQKVQIGDPLIQVDLVILAEKQKDSTVIVVFPEMKGKEVLVNPGNKKMDEVAATLK
ncbi:PTS glucose transporter subunit IIA [Enterococcus pseudoavium]|uniref:PTS glucose transporter subunit IIA n=1 Tax=Enterococcus pseudoavium TaxID=44007 RepID=A0AAE4I212_9ENTE|nr:PTS glucose transporter subunit IIA [Enterococcus pseudoavium]MDT2737017.1 PTS glucose transporter subunit IIA [Enterococcus pseudoavium]MDT2753853.1 PTS glucose transporter subunit IIA [Enterococcus pseudoavium]REC31395.1 sugar permease [Enterococcus pseudoavium]REC33480.1 sugar permease [Enterococcus pseudoavium]